MDDELTKESITEIESRLRYSTPSTATIQRLCTMAKRLLSERATAALLVQQATQLMQENLRLWDQVREADDCIGEMGCETHGEFSCVQRYRQRWYPTRECCSEQVRQVPMPVCTRGKIPLYYCIVGLYWRHGDNPFLACRANPPHHRGTPGFSCKGTTNG